MPSAFTKEMLTACAQIKLALQYGRIEGKDFGLFEVGAKNRRCKFAITAAAGIEELIMLCASLAADLCCGIVGANIAVYIGMELLNELEQESISSGLVKRKMESKIEILKLVCIGLNFTFFEYGCCFFDKFIGHKRDCRTDCAHFKNDTGIHCVFEFVTGELGNDCTPIGVDSNKTLCIQLTESFPDGNVADAELSGNLILTKGHTAGENPTDNCCAQNLEDPVPCRH